MSNDQLALYVTGAAIAGGVIAFFFTQSQAEERYRQYLSKKNKQIDTDLLGPQHPCADIRDVASAGELDPQHLTLVDTVPGTYGSTRYIYRTNTTGSIVSSYSPLLEINNRRV